MPPCMKGSIKHGDGQRGGSHFGGYLSQPLRDMAGKPVKDEREVSKKILNRPDFQE